MGSSGMVGWLSTVDGCLRGMVAMVVLIEIFCRWED